MSIQFHSFENRQKCKFVGRPNEIFVEITAEIWYDYVSVMKGENMAKDMLDAVYAAEEEFRRREGEAKKQADKTVADAKKKAEALIDARMAKANADADAELAKAKAACDKLMQQAEADAKAECKQIAQTAKKNRPSVIKKAAEALLS